MLAGVAALIGAEDDMHVFGTARSLGEAVELITEQSPDVILCDVQLGPDSGVALLDLLPAGQPSIVLLSGYEHPGYNQAALDRRGRRQTIARLLGQPLRNSPWYRASP